MHPVLRAESKTRQTDHMKRLGVIILGVARTGGGIRPELVRRSGGLEHIDDIVEGLDRALAASAAS